MVGVTAACQNLGVPRSSLYRHRQGNLLRGVEEPANSTPAALRPDEGHPRGLSEQEKITGRQILNSERFADSSPGQVYASVLDEGRYLCSWRNMYPILEEHDEVRERRSQRQHVTFAKPELLATAPRQLWSWDITKLKGPAKWVYYYLYVILDVNSRYVVGWMIAECEQNGLASQLIAHSCRQDGIHPQQLTLHADRGSSMRSKTVAQLLDELGVSKTHSRPYTANDNPYSEAQFKTMKYRPDYPERFGSLADGRSWARPFFHWYNHHHSHSGLGLLTPASVHYGHAEAVIAQRQQVLDQAYLPHPERFVKGPPQHPQLPRAVWINPPMDNPHGLSVEECFSCDLH